MSLKEKARKIDDCLVACINFEKKLDQYQGMQTKFEKMQNSFNQLISKDIFEDSMIKLDNQRIELLKADSII